MARSRRHLLASLGLAAAASIAIPSIAHAHPLIDEAARKYEEAEFEAALELLSQAEGSGEMTRADLVPFLTTRALVHVGTGDDQASRRDLLQLATLEPGYQLGPAFPPAVRQTFDAIRREARPLVFDASATPIPAALRIAVTSEDTSGLVLQVRIGARVDGGPWRREARETLEVPAPAGARVEWYAEGVGIGGVVLSSVGNEAAPEVVAMPGAPERETRDDHVAVDADEGGSSAWLWIGLGAVVIGAAAALTYFLFLDDPVSDQTELDPPML